MSCILRASGSTFEADSFIAQTSLVADSLWRKGEKRFPLNKTREETNDSSGIRVVASEADFSDLAQQIDDVILFLRQNQVAVTELVSFPGVESAFLDFGAEIYPPGWATFTFPAELLRLAGATGVSLCLSVYPTEHEGQADV